MEIIFKDGCVLRLIVRLQYHKIIKSALFFYSALVDRFLLSDEHGQMSKHLKEKDK